MSKLAAVTTLYSNNRRNVAETLRAIADEIDEGIFPNVIEATVVLKGDSLEVFAMGAGDVGTAHILLACGQRKLENAILRNTGEIY